MSFLTSVHVPSCFYASADAWACASVLSRKAAKRLCCSYIRGSTAMTPLITADERSRLLANGQGPRCRAGHRPAAAPGCACRLAAGFARPSRWRYRPRPDRQGLACALGTVKLSDAAIVGPRQQPVMRDRYFQPVRRLSDTCDWPKTTARSPIERHRKARRTVSISVWSVTVPSRGMPRRPISTFCTWIARRWPGSTPSPPDYRRDWLRFRRQPDVAGHWAACWKIPPGCAGRAPPGSPITMPWCSSTRMPILHPTPCALSSGSYRATNT